MIADVNNQLAPIGPNNLGDVQNWYNLQAERSVSEMDVSKQFSASFVVELPFGPGKALLGGTHGLSAKLIGGWQVNGIATHKSGLPLTISAAVAGPGNRPNSTGESAAITGSRSHGEAIEEWFDTAQLTQPAPYTFGNVGRTLPDVRSPGNTNFDVSLIKNTAVTERLNAQFRAEAFNVFNRPFFGLPITNLNDPSLFGKIRGTLGLPRVLQFAVRLTF